MVITVTCPSCTSSFPVDPAKIPEGGVNARCTSCGDIFRIDKPVEPAPPPAIPDVVPVAAAVPPEAAPVVEEAAPVVEEAAPAVEEPAPSLVDSPEDWVMENEEVSAVEAEPLPPVADHLAAATTPEPEPLADPFEEAAPFEKTASVEEVPPPAEPLPAPTVAEEAAPAAEEAATSGIQGFTFGKRDPADKAKRLARVLVSDMIMYNAERHQSALAGNTLTEDFEEEIAKSWKEYVEQVGDELANGPGRQFWTDALNDILAKGEQVF